MTRYVALLASVTFWPSTAGHRLAAGIDEIGVASAEVAVPEPAEVVAAEQVCDMTEISESETRLYTLNAFPAPQYSEESPVQVMEHLEASMMALPALKQLPQ